MINTRPKTRKYLWLLLISAIFIIAVHLLVFLVQDGLIFPGPRMTEAQEAAIREATPGIAVMTLRSAGVTLRGWAAPARGRQGPVLLYFGGNGEEVSGSVSAFSTVTGCRVVSLNYRGYGLSGGAPSEAALYADALALYDALRAEGVAPERIIAVGRSLGSGVAVYLAARRPVAGVILITPYDSMVRVAQHHYPYLAVSLLLRHRFPSIRRAPALTVPALFLVAEQDEVIPPIYAHRLYQAWGGPKAEVIIPGGNHNALETDAYWQVICRFVADHT